jgi:hypothetical protein
MQKIFIAAALLICFSCSKEDDNTETLNVTQPYVFSKSDFTGITECYDSSLSRIDYFDPPVKYDFLFEDGDIYPYKKIEINEDSSVYYHYVSQEVENTDKGYVESYHDSLYFFITNRYQCDFLFCGVLKNGQLRIPAYGYRVYFGYYFNDRYYSFDTKKTLLGFPDLQSLKDQYYHYSIERIFIQKFDLLYTIE